MKLPSRRYWPLIIVGVALILAVSTRHRTLPLMARWLDVGRSPQKADAVVLLNGGLNTRPFVAAALVHGGWAPKIVVNTVAPYPSQINGAVPSMFEINLRILAYGGVPRDQVVCLDSTAQTTFDEARAVGDYLAQCTDHHPIKKLLIVTEGPHSRRTRWIFQQVLAGRPVEITIVSAPTDEFDSENWWQSEGGFLFIISEYFKLLFYALRYGWLGYEMAGGMAVMIFLRAWFLRRRKLYTDARRPNGSPTLANS